MSLDLKVTHPNYCATIVNIESTVKLDGLDNLVGVPIFGFNALVSKDYTTGPTKYILFTAETQLSEQFCSKNNLYDRSELNEDPLKKGYINSKRRVRALKLKGHNSSALLMKVDSLDCLGIDSSLLNVGDSFNQINGIDICTKYIIRHQRSQSNKVGKPRPRKFKNRSLLDSRLIPEHIDTTHWARNKHKVSDDTQIIVSQKLEGTSVRLAHQKIISYPKWLTPYLIKLYDRGYGNYKIIKWIEKYFRKTNWAPIAGSRRVIKLKDVDTGNQSYYEEDIYNKALDKISNTIPKNWVLYGEIIGWVGQKPIQPKYTYNVERGEIDLYLYRIAIVNEDGLSCDLSYDQMVNWAKENGLKTCPEIYRGPNKNFDYTKYMDISYHKNGMKQCVPLSKDSPCDEGVVIRIDGGLTPELYKAKSPVFLGYETKLLDQEVISIEDEENSGQDGL